MCKIDVMLLQNSFYQCDDKNNQNHPPGVIKKMFLKIWQNLQVRVCNFIKKSLSKKKFTNIIELVNNG